MSVNFTKAEVDEESQKLTNLEMAEIGSVCHFCASFHLIITHPQAIAIFYAMFTIHYHPQW